MLEFKTKIINIVALVIILLIFINFTTLPKESNKYLDAIKLGGEWFLNNQDDNFLHYTYYPGTDSYDDGHHALRELASLWSIATLGKFLDDDRYTKLADKGLKYFESFIEKDEEGDFLYINIDPKKVKLGSSAFAVLAIVEIDHPKKDEYLEGLAKGILSLQQEDGSFNTLFFPSRKQSENFYPGEALVALMSLYEYNKDPQYLEAVKKALPYYRQYWDNEPNTAFAPWQSRAYQKYFEVTGDTDAVVFVINMTDYILNHYGGGCSNFNIRGSVIPVHLEGVNKAYEIAKKTGDIKREECYGNFMKEAMDYTLTLQATDPKVYTERGLGGVMNTDKDSMRVDRNQHAVMALMDSLSTGLIE
jgi:hypothetical protein